MEGTIVLYPCPGRGHLVSMVELGKLIITYHPCFSVAIIISTAPFESADSTADYLASVSTAFPSITFYHLPPVSLLNNFSSPADFPALILQLAELSNPNLHQTLVTLSKSSNLKAFVIDFFCNVSFDVSYTLKIPTYYYFTTSVNGLAALLYFPTFHKNTTKNLKDLDKPLDFPGIPPIPPKDMPEGMLDRSCKVYQSFVDIGTQMRKSVGLIVNTFELLEERAFKTLLKGECVPGESMPPVYCIGPVIGGKSGDDKDEHECLSWLDSQPSRSVLFLTFVSMGVLYTKQLKEIATGLERSGVRFLWVVRIPPPNDEIRRTLAVDDPRIELFLPEGFLNRTKDRGLVVKSWAPQVAVLNHNSIGGFVTHCGWNSVLEAVCAGVPMLAWPLYAEQKMNKVFMVEEMRVALPVESKDGLVSATELEKRVTELMDSEKGRAVRDRVMAMSDGAAAATNNGGSSRVALAKLTESFKEG